MKTKPKSIPISMLVLINVATILSIRNWPFLAEYGFSSFFFLIVAAASFFIPVSLVAAELASGWPQPGGIYVWVKEALGKRMAFLSVLLLWISNVVWYPTILSFLAVTLTYAINPTLAHNVWVNFFVTVGIFWSVLIANFFGVKFSGWLSSIAVVLGTLLPGLLLIAFGCLWFCSGQTCQITCSAKTLLPTLNHFDELAFLAGVLLSFAGMEMNAFHANNIDNPQKNFPRSIFFSLKVILLLTLLGTFSIGIVIPKEQISLVSATMETISFYFHHYGWDSWIPLIALLIGFGSFGGMSVWISGTNQGLLSALELAGVRSNLLKVNKNQAPVRILVLQGVIVSALCSLTFIMPTLSSSFWILTALASQFYIIVYILLFLSALLLRYKRADVYRAYRVPGGKIGLTSIAALGIVSCGFALAISFVPPGQLETGNLLFYEAFFAAGWLMLASLLFLIKQENKAPAMG